MENRGQEFKYRAPGLMEALEPYTYRSCMGHFGFRECWDILTKKNVGPDSFKAMSVGMTRGISALQECIWGSKTGK